MRVPVPCFSKIDPEIVPDEVITRVGSTLRIFTVPSNCRGDEIVPVAVLENCRVGPAPEKTTLLIPGKLLGPFN